MKRQALVVVVCLLAAVSGHGVGRVGVHDQIEHCSSFLLDNGGRGVFGANFDHTLTDEGLVFVNLRGVEKASVSGGDPSNRFEWTSRYASVSFNLVGYHYSWAGMNEAGLSISTMSLAETQQPPPDHRPALDNGEWVQYLLDTCATVDEVIATDDDVRILTVDHYLVGDGSGNAATIEFLEGRMVVHTDDDLPVAALTNGTYAGSALLWQMLRDGGDYSAYGSSLHRFCLAADRVDGFRPTTSDEAVSYAFDTLDLVRGERFSASPTNWSLVFDSENQRVFFRTRRNPDLRWVDLGQLDLRCGHPVRMIDIHDGGPGNATADLFDFDAQLNRFHFERFLHIWGINLSQQDITWVLNQLGSFDCAPAHRRSTRRVAP